VRLDVFMPVMTAAALPVTEKRRAGLAHVTASLGLPHWRVV